MNARVTRRPDAAGGTALLVSGGVDSAVAAHLLCEQGLRPDLFYISIAPPGNESGCTVEEDLELSSLLARRYGLRLEVVDLRQAYEERVTAYVVDRLRRGLTPNPDILCNRLIKFGAFEEYAGHRYACVATGHYARVLREEGGTWLGTSPDPVKDQTDFLSQIDGAMLRKVMFPVGHLTKREVRALAVGRRLPPARRRDSQGLCFLGQIDYSGYIKGLMGISRGDIVEKESGRVLGRHDGYWTMTIGQRKGMGLPDGPWYVTDKDLENNIIYVSHREVWAGKMQCGFRILDFRFIAGDPWHGAASAGVLFKIRHTMQPRPATFRRLPDGHFLIRPAVPLQGVAPGQFCVLYTSDGRICAGSGEIRL